MPSGFPPRGRARRGLARMRARNRASATAVRTSDLTITHATTTNADTAVSTPPPLGRLILAKLKRLLSAPPGEPQPYVLPPPALPPPPRGCSRPRSRASPHPRQENVARPPL